MASLCVYMVIFLLTWSSAVRGIPRTRDQQCKDLGYDVACKFDDGKKPCEILHCGRETNRNTFLRFPQIPQHGVPDGTQCGPLKICANKKCVPAKGPMPHYRGSQKLVQCRQRVSGCNQQLLTRNEQCQQYGFDIACQYSVAVDGDHAMCRNLSCGYKGRKGWYLKPYSRDIPMVLKPMEGTQCGQDKICLNQKCVPLSSWPTSEPLPKYTVSENITTCFTLPR